MGTQPAVGTQPANKGGKRFLGRPTPFRPLRRLREVNAQAATIPGKRPVSDAVTRYVALFNQKNWDGLRSLLADDVKLHQSTYPLRVGSADVGRFFTIYATFDGVRLVPAWVEGREVIAVFEKDAGAMPSY
ncbi:nuclear transport factor 2 family protein, partial [Bradyrhizobium sp.]|uniref:nuclear transport factor 2 family protein n=1 Tax=Bradyrhizobium sp. TaxID=376 RepID=UPI0023A60748|nr:nuclear transport factor 2 family protein [Bradyrhizobium sp.]